MNSCSRRWIIPPSGKKLGEFLVDEGIVSEDDLAKALSKQLDLDMIDLQSINVDKEVLNLVPVNVLKKNKIFPFAYKENNFNVLMVAMRIPWITTPSMTSISSPTSR